MEKEITRKNIIIENTKPRNTEGEEIVLYTVDDIRRVFKIGRTKAYELMSAAGFPSFRMNNRLYVEKGKLIAWINKRDGKSFCY